MSAPFGIELNHRLDRTSELSDYGNNKFEVTPPKPHPAFTTFIAEDNPTYGVVWLKAISPLVSDDAYGSAIQRSFEQVSAQLSSRYGNPKRADLLKQGAIWTETREWVSSLQHSERIFFHMWDRENGANLPDDIQNVFLGVSAHSSSDCSFFIEYSSSRAADAERDAENSLSDLL